MKRFILPVLFAIILLSLSFISAAPPFISEQITEGYAIADNPRVYLKVGQCYQYNFFVYNLTNGALKTSADVNCIHYIANSTGEVIFYAAVPYNPAGYWGIDIAGGNFSHIGTYAYGTRCNSSVLAGQTTGLWEVTANGFGETSQGEAMIIACMLFIILALAIGMFLVGMFGGNPLLKLTGFILSALFFIMEVFYGMVVASDTTSRFIASSNGFTTFAVVIGIAAGIGVLALVLFGLYMSYTLWRFKRGRTG